MRDYSRDIETIYREFAPGVRQFASRKVPDPMLVEDATQETFIRAWRSLPNYDPRRPLWPWLATIAARHCFELRIAFTKRKELPILATDRPETSGDISPEEAALGSHREALSAIPSRYARALVLKYVYNFRCEEIARIERASLSAIESRLVRARRALRAATLRLQAAEDC